MASPSGSPGNHHERVRAREQSDHEPQTNHPIRKSIDWVTKALSSAFSNEPHNRRLTPGEIAARQARLAAQVGKPAQPPAQAAKPVKPNPEPGPADPERRTWLIAGLTGAAVVGAAVSWKLSPSTPAPSKPRVEKREHRETYPRKNTWLDDAIKAQSTILTTDPAERTAYYLDDALDIVHEAEYLTFTVDPRDPNRRAPAGAITFPARQPRQNNDEYEEIKEQAVDAWHDKNRRTYGKKSAQPVSTKEDYPMANVSPNSGSTFNDVWAKAEGNLDTVQTTFRETFKKTKLYQDMPEAAREEMIRVCTQGQISNESQWSPELTSNSKEPARGPWQIKPSTANDAIRKNPDKLTVETTDGTYDLHNFEHASMTAVLCYEQIYLTLKPTLEEVQKKFNLTDNTFYQDFVIPCLVNAYHNGQGGMSKVINWFLKNYNVKNVAKILGPDANQYGTNLYFFMSRSYFSHANDGDYGRKSFQYAPKCYAYAALFDQQKSPLATQQ